MLKWDFTKLSTVGYETDVHKIDEDYQNISVITKTADIVFTLSENAKTSVTCHEQKNVKHSVAVKDGTLVIEVVDTRKWYEHIGFNFQTPQITVSIPRREYGTLSISSSTGDVDISKEFKFQSITVSENTGNVTNYASASEGIKIKTTTGNIHVENASAQTIDLSVSTGKITASGVSCSGDITVGVSTGKVYLTDISCQSVISDGTTGDISLDRVIASGKLSIKRSTGDVKLEGSDAAEIFIETDTGDVTGTLLSDKVFIVQTDTGSVDVPKTVTGGRCEIRTDTGDIRIKLLQS